MGIEASASAHKLRLRLRQIFFNQFHQSFWLATQRTSLAIVYRAVADPWKSLNFFPDFQGFESPSKDSVLESPWIFVRKSLKVLEFGFLIQCLNVCSYCAVSGKKCHYVYASNIAKCWPVFKMLLPTDSAVNVQQIDNKISHLTSNAWLHYLVKY